MFDAASQLVVARQHHARGEVAAAEQIYRQILSHEPQNADALTLLGAACIGQGRPAEAVELLQTACRVHPQHAAAHDNLGVALAKLGRFAEAQGSFQQATLLEPRSMLRRGSTSATHW